MLKRIDPDQILLRPFEILDEQWALLASGRDRPNLMTISWGGLGTLWNRPVATVYVRPPRHTFRCLEEFPDFTVNVLPARWRPALDLCGSKSGRDLDKWAATGLTRLASESVAAARVGEALLTLECRTLATLDIDPKRFLDPAIESLYPARDYHRAYLGQVLGAWADAGFRVEESA